MENKETGILPIKKYHFLSGGGEMGELIRNFDWTKTPLGPPQHWEQSLKTCVRIMLSSSQPIWIGWGNDLIKLYNDPYKAIAGGKHPWALGQPISVVWKDIWKDIEPLLKKAMENDEGSYQESQLLIMERNNYPEETYYTFSYTPIPGDSGDTAGIICANTDDTTRIINERALQTLRDLGNLSYHENTLREIYSKAAKVLANNKKDFPFAVFYEVNTEKMNARPVAWAGDKDEYDVFPQSIDFQNPVEGTHNICRAINNSETVISENNGRRPGSPKGFWPVPPKQFLHIPLALTNHKFPVAILTVGLNPYRPYDRPYQQFTRLLADQLSIEINKMHALEEERKKAEALAEIDRAKTVFFNNISHEFRTPLTLMLGPLEDLMQQSQYEPRHHHLSSLATAHRNALRLLKLVNTLLDFSRIESGRQQASYTLVDIAALTKNLASSFRSIVEKSGLLFIVNAGEIIQPVYVDKQMWEKIVFNLLSNAFKYTLTGSIRLNLFSAGNKVVLEVIDTGVGIPENELPRMFERFHRVEGTVGRTYEGTGIGLSMIKELVHLHHGMITVQSKEGEGSRFTVTIPTGKEHLQSSAISEADRFLDEITSNVYVEEANTFLAGPNDNDDENYDTAGKPSADHDLILIADDNADMREYLKALLKKEYTVITAVNGMDALHKIVERSPSLVLSDVMMPIMDGIQLLKEIKLDARVSHIPVILLSARAGEEYRIEGIDIGADDYLVKPFAAKELTARIRAQLNLAKKRKHTEQQLKNLFLQAPVGLCIFRGPLHIVNVVNEKMLEIWDRTMEDVINRPLFEALPDAKEQAYEELLDKVYKTGDRFVAPEMPVFLVRNGRKEKLFVKLVFEAFREESGSIIGVMALADEVTEQVMARKRIEENEEQLRIAIEGGELGTFDYYPVIGQLTSSEKTKQLFGLAPGVEANYDTYLSALHPDDKDVAMAIAGHAGQLQAEGFFEIEFRTIGISDGVLRWLRSKGKVSYDEKGNAIRYTGVVQDITKSKMAEEEKQTLIAMIDASDEFIGLAAPDTSIRYINPAALRMLGWDTVQGRNIVDCIYPDDRELAKRILSELDGKDFFSHEIRIWNETTGEAFWIQWNGFTIRDAVNGQVIALATVSPNITQRKASEGALKESEKRFRNLAETLPQLIWVTDEKGNMEFTSSRWEEYTGIRPEDEETWRSMVHPDDYAHVNKAWKDSLVDGELYNIDLRLKNKNGEYRWHSVNGVAVPDIDNKIIKWVGAFTDIHDRKEEERRKDDFIKMVSHELKTPVTSIKGYVQLMLRMLQAQQSPGYPAQVTSSLARIDKLITKLTRLITEMLDLSRIESGRLELTRELFTLNDLVDDIVEDIRHTNPGHTINVDHSFHCNVFADKDRIGQVITNFISNAIKYSPNNNVIEVHVYPDGINSVGFSVKDYGIGIDKADLTRIFERFYRVEGKNEKTFPGFGIGLFIASEIIERHNGQIGVNSELEKGSVFYFSLPVVNS